MPAEGLVALVEEKLRAADIGSVEVVSAELYDLAGQASIAVVDEMVVGSDFPMVLVADRVVCTGDVDLDAIVAFAEAQQ